MEFLSPLSSWILLFYSIFNHLVLFKPSGESLNPKLYKDALKIILCIYFCLISYLRGQNYAVIHKMGFRIRDLDTYHSFY